MPATDAHKIAVKLFLVEGSRFPFEQVVPVFHSWIQEQVLADHLLIDVADYAHVHHGPGVLLVSHEANIYTDQTGGHDGLLYARKQPAAGAASPFRDRLRQALAATIDCARRLEQDPRLAGQVRFGTDVVSVRINDRLLAPNTPETYEQVKGDVQAVLDEVYGSPVALQHKPGELTLFEVVAKAAASPSLADLQSRVPAAAPVA